jgi:hypothetical protein
VIGGAALGTLVTAATGSEPGYVIGVFLVAATAAAALAVQPRAVYRIVPVPALAYVIAAAIAGLIHDRATDTSRTVIATSATQWIASGFLAMTAATILAIAMTAARGHRRKRGPRGPGYRLPAAEAVSSRRPPPARSPRPLEAPGRHRRRPCPGSCASRERSSSPTGRLALLLR